MKIAIPLKLCLVLAWLSCASLAQAENLLYTEHPLVGKFWDMRSRSFIDEAALLERANAADVLLIGETHDNPEHHEFQQKLLRARLAAGGRPALMMEQLDAESQQELDRVLADAERGEALPALNGLIKFTDWGFYSPFLAIAYDNKLPVIAANIPSRRLQMAIWRGYDSYDADEIKRLAVQEVWSDERQEFLAANMGGAHCGKLRDELRIGLTRSQRLRDAYMTDSAVASIGRGVVGIVGSSHARYDIGLPLYFTARAPQARILSIGMMEVRPAALTPERYEGDSATGEAPYDVLWFAPRVERSDPCAKIPDQKEEPDSK